MIPKHFATADCVRDELAAEGAPLEDRPKGTNWRRVVAAPAFFMVACRCSQWASGRGSQDEAAAASPGRGMRAGGPMIMKWHLSIAAFAALITLAGPAEAGETLTAGPSYGGAEQLVNGALVVCHLFNTGGAAAVISTRQLFNSSRGLITPVGNTCTSALAPQKSCDYYAKTGPGTYTCRVVLTEGTLAGTMEIYSSTDQLLVSVPMIK